MSYRRMYASPPVWDAAALERDRQRATANFISAWHAAGRLQYEMQLAENMASVRHLFDATDDLLTLPDGTALVADPSLLRAARFLGGPPVSEANLDTLASAKVETRRRLDLDLARQAAVVILSALDRSRLPWLFETPPRHPTTEERQLAIRWTAGLMTTQAHATALRGESSARQEELVERLLIDLGFSRVSGGSIDVTRGLNPGQYSRETHVAGIKCDIPIGLHDGRFLLVECKVSNSGTNSVKRLNRECGGKVDHWRVRFGERAVAAAVVAGVFKLKNLQDAQHDSRLTIFWEHDLAPLADFLQAAR